MKSVKYLVALLITTVCLYVAFRGVNLGRAWSIVTDQDRIRLLPLAAFSAISLGVMWIRGWRWKYLFQSEHHATVNGLTTANLIGFTTNNILPLRIGELVRALVARRKVEGPMSYVLASLVIERIFDSICLLLCLVIPLAYTESFPPAILKIAQVMLYLLAGAVVLLILLGNKPHTAEKAVVKLTGLLLPARFHEKVKGFMGMFTEGMKVLRKKDVLVKVSVLSVLHWGAVVFSFRLAFAGFSFDSLPWTSPFLTLGIVGMGVALPSAPAFIGPIHWAIIFSLHTAYGLPNDDAAALAVVMHILMMVPVTVAGLIAMAREGMTFGQLRYGAEHLDEAAEPEQVSVQTD
ncbi:MAG: flippase-like domain-containing protein [Candidatus Glassbacteria bacterium]|nr:flippase-like domain-containing protein [Candidatus Glassbacteria bacterium]